MEKYDVVLLAFNRWDQQSSSATLSLAKEWSKSHRVFYIDKPYSIKDLFYFSKDKGLTKRIKALLFGKGKYTTVETGFSKFIVLTPGLNFPINFLPPGIVYNLLRKLNEYLLWRSVKQMMKEFSIENYIYINHFFPILLPVIHSHRYKPLLNIYQCQHDILLTRYLQKHGPQLEGYAVKHADIVTVSSKNLYRKFSDRNTGLCYLPNAVDSDLFEAPITNPEQRPFDLENSGNTPIILFAGYLSRIRVDYVLLRELCESFPQYLVVVVGTYDEKDVLEYKLDQIHNLLLMGNRRREAIPRYVSSARVTIIPYLCNMLNKSLFPMKLNEYLAMGKPVITTNFSEDLQAYRDVIHIAGSLNDFIDGVGNAIHEKDEHIVQLRKIRASENTWISRVDHLQQLVEKKLNSNGK